MTLPRILRPTRRAAAMILAAAVLGTTLVGCYGRFPLTNAVYDWNGRVTNNHIVNSVIMVVISIIPVYAVCILVDAIVINSIEYWTEDRVTVSQSWDQPDGTRVTLEPGTHEDHAVLTMWRGEEKLLERHYLRGDNGLVQISDESGRLVGSVQRHGDGSLALFDGKGVAIDHFTPEAIAAYKAQVQM